MKAVKLLFVPLFLFLSCSNTDESIYDTLLNIDIFNSQNPYKITKSLVFHQGDLIDKKCTRIPTIIIANNGNILAACEKRQLFDDKGEIDILLAVSVDNGKAYNKSILFKNDTKNGRKMNPSFVVDRNGTHGAIGRIYCFVLSALDPTKYVNQQSKEKSNTLYKYSDDNGLTWSEEFELKNKIPDECVVFGPSPANGIQLNNGTLVLPAFVTVSDNTYRSGIIFKSPQGDWEFSYIKTASSINNNECTILPSASGNSVILNARMENNHYRNVYQTSDITKSTKGSDVTWQNHSSDKLFRVAGACQASLEQISAGDTPIYLFSNPVDNPRNRICIWYSLDMHEWIPFYLLTTKPSAGYSVVTYYEGKLLAIYESTSNITECEIQNLSPLLNYLKAKIYEDSVTSK